MAPIAAIEGTIVCVLGEGLCCDVDGAFGFAVILEETRDRHDAEVILALTERCPFFREHADDRVGVSAHANDFADRRFMREQPFLDHLSDDNHAS